MEEARLVSLCFADPICVAWCAAVASAMVAAGRRLLAIDKAPRRQRGIGSVLRQTIGGALIASGVAGPVCYLGGLICSEQLGAVAAVTVLGGVAIDFSSVFAQRLLRTMLASWARAYLRAAKLAEDLEAAAEDLRSFPDDE